MYLITPWTREIVREREKKSVFVPLELENDVGQYSIGLRHW